MRLRIGRGRAAYGDAPGHRRQIACRLAVAIAILVFRVWPAPANQLHVELRMQPGFVSSVDDLCARPAISKIIGVPIPWQFDQPAPPTELLVRAIEFEFKDASRSLGRFAVGIFTYERESIAELIDIARTHIRAGMPQGDSVELHRSIIRCPTGQILGSGREPIWHRSMGRPKTVTHPFAKIRLLELISIVTVTPLPAGRAPIAASGFPPAPRGPSVRARTSTGDTASESGAGKIDDIVEAMRAGSGTRPIDAPATPRGAEDVSPSRPKRTAIVEASPSPPLPDSGPDAAEKRVEPPGKYPRPSYPSVQSTAASANSVGPIVELRRKTAPAASPGTDPGGTTSPTAEGAVFAIEAVECSDEGNWMVGYFGFIAPDADGRGGKLGVRQRYALNNYPGEGRIPMIEVLRRDLVQCDPGGTECSAPRQVRPQAEIAALRRQQSAVDGDSARTATGMLKPDDWRCRTDLGVCARSPSR